jgi:putative serine protease PepD
MSGATSSILSRVCPACARRVAPPATTCRCGRSVDGVLLTAAPAQPLPVPPPETNRLEIAAKIAIALVGVIAGASMIYRASTAPAGTAPPAKSIPPAAPIAGDAGRPPAPETPPAEAAAGAGADAPTPTALERVMAAAAASKRAESAAAPAGAAAPLPPSASLEDMIGRAMPAVVRVETATAIGSGFFITPDTMLTNAHVVGTNTVVSIRRRDGRTISGRVDVTAPELDIAVVRIGNPDPGQATLTLGAGASARAGQEVVALGTPLGLQNTVTRGIVSAVRDIGGLTLVQTDAAINPGNSGGPLLDRSGSVIGITSLGVKSAEAQGLGFAIAIEHAQALLAGKRSTDQKGTPLSTLNEAMSGRAAPAATDAGRERGAKVYQSAIEAQAQRADALDERWRAFKRICYQGDVAAVPGREWFAIWDPHAMQGIVPPGCASAFGDIQRAADEIRAGVLAAGEAARQAAVYPGTRREVLQRYHLNYAGWDR